MSAGLDAEQKFGPYLVYERLGVGGMATVHRALERGIEGFERLVALKRLLPHLAEDASFIKAFVREAKLASLLNHINIVQIFELGRVGTEYFISMEYIDGRDIRRILRHARKVTGPPPINITVGMLLQLCDALDYAHTKVDEDARPLGLVHRDVSPSNVIVSTTGLVKMIDFGIAKAQTQKHRTQTGRVKGKLAYMAPEAVSGRGELDARSDLFAVGVIAHELLTARPLFASKNDYDTLLKVQRGEILPPSTFNPSCPPELDAIVLRALARTPDERYASAAKLRDDLMVLRKRYSLQTSYRDISTWVDWAFAADTDDPDASVVEVLHSRTPAPRSEDEDAVEIAWGLGDGEANGPIVLDDVPDVSEKYAAPHLAPHLALDEDDDIPTPVPTHGRRASRHLPTMREPDEDYDAPLELAADPAREARVTGQRPSAPRLRPPSSFSTEPMGQALLDALDDANLAAETLRGMQPSDTQPSLHAAPPGPDDPGTDELALPPMRATPSVFTSARHPDERPALPRTSKQELEAALASDDPPTVQVPFRTTTPGAVAAITSRGEDVPTHQIPLRPTPPPGSMPRATPPLPVVRFKKPSTPPPTDFSAEVANAPAVVAPPLGTPALTLPAEPTGPAFPRIPTPVPPTSDASVPLGMPINTPVKSIRTKPGHAPAKAPAAELPVLAPPRASSPALTSPGAAIGAAMIERSRRGPKRWWLIVAGLAAAGAIATAATLALMRGGKVKDVVTPPAPKTDAPLATVGTVKFVTEPADAEISIEGRPVHHGAPWTTELEPGTYQIQITRSGYKSWLTSLELSPRENHMLRVVLEKLSTTSAAAPAMATLLLSSTPSGLEAELDGKLLPGKTPLRMPLPVGPHTIALRKDGAVVWRQELNASAAVDYEFNPSMEEAKQRERDERRPPRRAVLNPAPKPPTPDAADQAPAPATTPSDAAPATDTVPTKPAAPAVPPGATPATAPGSATDAPTTPAKPATPAPAPTVTPAAPAPAAPKSTTPLTVPPTAVTKLSGATPELARSKEELPSTVAAKVCINHAGKVTSVDLITKLDPRSASELTATLETWKYSPYMHQGVAIAACFAVSLRLR